MQSKPYIDSLAWILVQDRMLLSVRTKGKRKFYLPGGKREPGESDLFGVLHEQADGYTDGRRVHMTAYTARHRGELRPGAEIAEARWLRSADARACPPAGRRVLDMLGEAGRID